MSRLSRFLRSADPTRVIGAIALVGFFGFVTGTSSSPTFTPGIEPENWPTSDGIAGTHYSALSDITSENVAHLEVAWEYRTGDVQKHEDGLAGTAFESTPVMVDGVLYIITPFSRAIALDAETGRELWTFDPRIDRTDDAKSMTTSRGLSVWTDGSRDPGEETRSQTVSR